MTHHSRLLPAGLALAAVMLIAQGCGSQDSASTRSDGTGSIGRSAAGIPDSGLTVRNDLTKSVTLRITEADPSDFLHPSPNESYPAGFQNFPVPAGQSTFRTIKVNEKDTSQQFYFRVGFDIGGGKIGGGTSKTVSMRLMYKRGDSSSEGWGPGDRPYGWATSDTGQWTCKEKVLEFPEYNARLRSWCDGKGSLSPPPGIPLRNPGFGTLVIEKISTS